MLHALSLFWLMSAHASKASTISDVDVGRHSFAQRAQHRVHTNAPIRVHAVEWYPFQSALAVCSAAHSIHIWIPVRI